MTSNSDDPDGQLSPTPVYSILMLSIDNDISGEYEKRQLKLTKLSDLMLKSLPQYLYRVASDDSKGMNSKGHYQAGSVYDYLGSANFYAFSKDDVRESIRCHVQNSRVASHWISFTSSMETIIDFALRMREKRQKNIRIHIIDTTRLEKPALIVHAHSMVTAYGAEPNRAHFLSAACMNTAQNEFLVWDEIRVSADVVSFDKLLSPDIPRPRRYTPGILFILHNIEKTPRNGKPAGATKARKIALFHGCHDKVVFRNLVLKSILGSGRISKPRPRRKLSATRVPEDARVPLDDQLLLDYFDMVKEMSVSVRVPMVVALLSTQIDFIDQESIIEQLVRYLEARPTADGIPNKRFFWMTRLRADPRSDSQIFEEMYSKICKQTDDKVLDCSILTGPENDHRVILRLDADPKVSNTTEARGAGPATMAMAMAARETQRTGLRPPEFATLQDQMRLWRGSG